MRLDAIPTADTNVLQTRFVELAAKLLDITTERKAIVAELQRRERDTSIAVRLSQMSDSDKQALRRALR